MFWKVDEYGNVLIEAKDIGYLPLRFRDELFNMNGGGAWVYFDVTAFRLVVCTIDASLNKACHPLEIAEGLGGIPATNTEVSPASVAAPSGEVDNSEPVLDQKNEPAAVSLRAACEQRCCVEASWFQKMHHG